MIRRILLALLLPLPLFAQSTVRGIVVEQNSGSRPVPGVQLKALGAAPEVSDNAGAFALSFSAKKPGDRIIVQEVAKAGYELVNRDAVSGWLIPSDPQARTKLVMCPEGTLARNIAKYYSISLAALTRGYEEQIRRLQTQLDSARIDRRAFGEAERALTARYQNQQGQIEELAERFARENFDDCSDVQRRAFTAFSNGGVEEAIRILESVNSEAEIEKAKAQRARGAQLESEAARRTAEADRMASAGRSMRSASDSIIRRHIEKLLFQARLYQTSNRYEEAGRTFAAAAEADTTNFEGVQSASEFFRLQKNTATALRWCNASLGAARTPLDTARTLREAAWILHYHQQRYNEAEPLYLRSLAILRRLMDANEQLSPTWVPVTLENLADLHIETGQYDLADAEIRQALDVELVLYLANPGQYGLYAVNALLTRAKLQCRLARCEDGEAMYLQAITVLRTLPDTTTQTWRYKASLAFNELAVVQRLPRSLEKAEQSFSQALFYSRLLAADNPERYAETLAMALNNLAVVQRDRRNLAAAEANQREAIALLKRLAEQNPERYRSMLFDYWPNLAHLYGVWGKYDSAFRVSREALAAIRPFYEADPAAMALAYAGILSEFGIALCHAGKADSADRVIDEVLRLDRAWVAADSGRRWIYLTGMLEKLSDRTYEQRLSQAIAYREECLRILRSRAHDRTTWNKAIARHCRWMAKFMMLSRRFTDAEAWSREAYEQFAHPRNHACLGAALLFQGRYDEARTVYETVQREPFDDLQTMREVFLADLDEFEKAGVTHPDVAKIRALLTATTETPK